MNDQSDADDLDSKEFQAWMNEFQQWQEAIADYAPAVLLENMMKDEQFLAFQRDFEAFQTEFKQFQHELEKEVSKRSEQKADGNGEPARKSADDVGAPEPAEEYDEQWWWSMSEESPQPTNNDDPKSGDSPRLHQPD